MLRMQLVTSICSLCSVVQDVAILLLSVCDELIGFLHLFREPDVSYNARCTPVDVKERTYCGNVFWATASIHLRRASSGLTSNPDIKHGSSFWP